MGETKGAGDSFSPNTHHGILNMALVYLAHPMGTYGSHREALAIALLEAAGHEVVNPREHQYSVACGKHMGRWQRLAAACDAVALLPYKDGKMGSGTKLEMDAAIRRHRPIFKITLAADAFVMWPPSPTTREFLDITSTAKRNEAARKARNKAGVSFTCADTTLRPQLLAQVLTKRVP